MLPEDIILHISGYYGEKIPEDLSREINDQRLLYAIKERDYYDEKLKIWNIGRVLDRLSSPIKHNYVWKDWNKQVNRIWWSYTSNQRREFFDKYYTPMNI